MQHLKELIEKYNEMGKKKSYRNGGDYNDYVEYQRIGELIMKEVIRLYDEGKIN